MSSIRYAFGMLVLSVSVCLSVISYASTYVVATDGADTNVGTYLSPFATLQKAVDSVKFGDTIVVRTGVYPITKSITISNKLASADAPITIMGENNAVLRATAEGVPGIWRGIIEVDQSSFIVIRNIRVENSSFFGIRIHDSRDIKLQDNRSTISLGSGIYARNSQRITILHNDVSRFCDRNEDYFPGFNCQEGISLFNVDGFSVQGNLVHDAYEGGANTKPGGGEGIDAKTGTKNGIIAFNLVWNLSHMGIYIDAGSMGVSNINVYGNRVWNSWIGIAVSSETGATASNIAIHDNIIHDNGGEGISITHITLSPSGNGLREHVLIYNNTVYNNGIKEAKPPYVALWQAPGAFLDQGRGIVIDTSNISDVQIFNNIVVNNKTFQIAMDPSLRPSVRVERNLIWPVAPTTDKSAPYNGVSPILADPKLVSPDTDDWHLALGSPAIGAGVAGIVAAVDANHNTRSANKVDIGALAY